MTTKLSAALAPYAAVLADWPVALVGAKPGDAELSVAHVFGRPGKQSLAIAMMLRPEGATASQIKQASALFDGNPTPHFNKAREQVRAGVFARAPTLGVYQLSLTAKGKLDVAKWGKQRAATAPVDDPVAEVKAKATTKPKGEVKAKAATKAAPKPKTASVAKPEPVAAPQGAVTVTPQVAPQGDQQPTA